MQDKKHRVDASPIRGDHENELKDQFIEDENMAFKENQKSP